MNIKNKLKLTFKNELLVTKSGPDVRSIDQQKKAGKKGAPWDGVRIIKLLKT